MMYAEITVLVDGALEEDRIFYDETLLAAHLDDLQAEATADGVTFEVYRIDHDHDPVGDCACVQYLTDHHPYRVIEPDRLDQG